ncbi:MAG: response regulator [Anaerolineaceae bacterium]|nr:response regulator [Anaerolineaceae bacterium]
MEQREFISLFKDLINHLYDFTVIETHPLSAIMQTPTDFQGSRGEYIRKMILSEIESLKPQGIENIIDIEWRPYTILKKRYVEGINLGELSKTLSLSERQLRRDNNRAIQALAGRIWDKLIAGNIDGIVIEDSTIDQMFDVKLEMLDLNEVILGIENILHKRLEMESVSLDMDLTEESVQVMADRVVIRQILISLVGYFSNFHCTDLICLRTRIQNQHVSLRFSAELLEELKKGEEKEDLLESTRYWIRQMNGDITVKIPANERYGILEINFKLPAAQRKIILVVDDQKPTQQMFKRFLSHTSFQVIGTTDPERAIALARQYKPSLITLDVMMPEIDGWELLQAMKTNPETKDISVLICSAWEEPDLAQTLGAAGFLKKPVRQRDLLEAFESLGLTDAGK